MPAATVKPYLDGLLFKLASLLQQNVKMVMEQALTAVAAVADCVEEEFAKYYDTFIPFLISGTCTTQPAHTHTRTRTRCALKTLANT